MAKESRSTAGMGGSKKSSSKSESKKSSKKHVHKMEIRRGASGGYIATHHSKPKPGEMADEPEEHVLPDMNQLQQHLSENMGDQPDQQAQPAPQGGAPAAGPAAPAMQAGM
jgi:hypothetical protein